MIFIYIYTPKKLVLKMIRWSNNLNDRTLHPKLKTTIIEYNKYYDVINWTNNAFHKSNDKTTPSPIPIATIPTLSRCIDKPPTNAPISTEIINAIHK